MGDVPSPPAANPPPRSNLPMLYYGLVVMATASIVLLLYNIIIIKWCADHRSRRRASHPVSVPGPGVSMISSSKYKSDGGGDSECVVCLSVLEEGEEVKKLPKCNHSFHAPCIDMWLYSHLDCPLCRSPVLMEQAPSSPQQHAIILQSDHSREILLGSSLFV